VYVFRRKSNGINKITFDTAVKNELQLLLPRLLVSKMLKKKIVTF